jgi:CheY-like chemotaxis protein
LAIAGAETFVIPDAAPPEGEVSSESRVCILVVEDELMIRLLISDELRDAGHHVIEAVDADEAVIILQTTRPDLIISDVKMPGSMDGMGLLAHVKRSFPELPVIITSGHAGAEEAKAQGASAFVRKPYVSETVLGAAENIISGKCNDGVS